MEKRFAFHGNAVGAAGHIHKPDDSIIWVQGASSLPVVGGYSRSHIERVKFGDVLFAESISTRTTGDYSEREKAYKTLANSVVKGLHIQGRLTADALEATLASTHPDEESEPTIVPSGTHIVNLRIDGFPINVSVDVDLFTKYATRESLSRAYAGDDAFFNHHGKRFQSSRHAQPPSTTNRQIPEVRGYITCSIVSEIRTEHPKIIIDGHVLTLDGFGRIYLGELLITSVSRRLTLLRVKLGSPIEGDVACADVESNGVIMD